MIRNGSLTLVAALMALALVVRLENTAQAEITYVPNALDIGDTAIIQYIGPGQTTIISGGPGSGLPTNGLAGTVFLNVDDGFIIAGPGSVISSSSGMYGGAPTISNGADNRSMAILERYYVVQITVNDVGAYRVDYGYYRQGDPPGTFIPITDLYDADGNAADLPQDILDGIGLASGSTLTLSLVNGKWGFSLPTGYTILGADYLDLEPNVPVLWPAGTPIGIINTTFPDYTAELPGLSDDDLDDTSGMTGEILRGNLTINPRNPRDPHNLVGNERTLIENTSGGTAIENHGDLNVFDSRVQTTGTGILHVFTGSDGYGGYYYDPITGFIYLTSGSGGDSVRLYNTQIGEPGFSYTDPITGETITMDGIAVNGNGTPIPTMSYLGPNQLIKTIADGRITVGQDVTLMRNPVGWIYQYPGKAPGTFAEAQYPNGSYFNGPSVGIRTQAHSMFENLFWSGMDFAYIANDDWGPYYNSRYFFYALPGSFDRSRSYNNLIEVRDNSWIFADTGISFGNPTEDDPIRVYIDKTSGIYANGIGITDSYSLMDVWVWNGNVDDPDWQLLGYYSGNFHEIQVDGKVIVGTPSQAGIQLTFLTDIGTLSSGDMDRLSKVYYYDPNDPDADLYGNVYFSEATADKFVAYNTQSNRVFWLRMPGGGSVPLTSYDYATQRWTVHPDAPDVIIRTGSEARSNYFSAFEGYSSGIGIRLEGGTMAWEGNILLDNMDPWSLYYGPTVREITALGDDALIAGGKYQSGGAAMYFDSYAHVSKVVIGDNKDVKNLSDVLYVGGTNSKGGNTLFDLKLTAQNFQAFDTMTSVKRSKLLYNPDVLYSSDPYDFHFDNAGVHGDIVSNYNVVLYLFGGSGVNANGVGWALTYSGVLDSFWSHVHGDDIVFYYDEVLGIGETSGFPGEDGSPDPSYLLGHRDGYLSDDSKPSWTADSIPGQSILLDEVLLWYLAGRQNANSNNYETMILPSFANSYGYGGANDQRHFREALARFLHFGRDGSYPNSGIYSGLTAQELLEGYTRDGTLLVFAGGDIFSGNIYGGGLGDMSSPIMGGIGTRDDFELIYGGGLGGMYSNPIGNIDLRFKDGTTIFNHNVYEQVIGTDIMRVPGIRVRDVYVEKTGHLLLNDAQFAVNPFSPFGSSPDYADRLIIHDVLNEGLVSGNGVFQIAQRWDFVSELDYFEGYFINRGVLAPGLPGFIGENEHQARTLEDNAYQNMLGDSAKFVDWEMRGVPGGQFGVITIFGSLRLMDEQVRPVFDPASPLFNSAEVLQAGEYHVTVGNDSIGGVLNKYAATIAQATSAYRKDNRYDNSDAWVYDPSLLSAGEVSKEDWRVIATEKLGTHLSWFSPAAMVDNVTGLPLLTTYEQFEYLTNATRRAALQRKMVEAVLTSTELRQYDADPVKRAQLNKRMFEQNNIRFELTQLDNLLMRFGFSDVMSVYGTIPPYIYAAYGWSSPLSDYGSQWTPPSSSNPGSQQHIGVTQLGGIVQADRIFDMDTNADKKEKQTSFIIIASEGYTFDGSIKMVTSATTDWVFANVDLLPLQLASGQTAAVLTVIDDPNYYFNRVTSVKSSYNARSVARTLDDAMFSNPGLAQSFNFGLNDPKVVNNVFRQVASSTRANSVVMNVWSPSDNLFNQIGYGHGGLSTGNRGNVVFRNKQTGQLQQPYGQPAVPPPGHLYAPPPGDDYRGQSPFYRTGSVWGMFTHSSFTRASDGNSFKYTFDRNGVMFGNEWNLSPSAVIGGAAHISEGKLHSLGDRVQGFDYNFGAYFVAAPFEQFEMKSYAGIGFQTYKSDRYIRNGDIFVGSGMTGAANGIFGINDHYDSETSGTSFNWAIELARPFTVDTNFVIRPAMGLEYQSVRQNAYTERTHLNSQVSWSNNGTNIAEGALAQGVEVGPTSGTYAMAYKSMLFSRTLSRVGFSTESYFARGGWQFRAYHVGRFAGNRYPISEQSFVSGSKLFKTRGADLGNSYAQVGFGSHLWLNRERTATVFANTDWNFPVINKGGSMFNVNIGIQQNF